MHKSRSLETGNLRKFVLAQKLWIPLHVPLNPFYNEMKELLHSEITLQSREYSKCEHIHECPLQQSPPELSKTGQITPKAVLKNHSKSQ
jgi:hypothetical protein